jgi:alpha-glucoside transport system permease protein
MNFPGRRFWFALVVALLVVPLQIAGPRSAGFRQQISTALFARIWLAHTGFSLPWPRSCSTATFVRCETLESAFIDGASHFTILLA